jgi:hypothetical protein
MRIRSIHARNRSPALQKPHPDDRKQKTMQPNAKQCHATLGRLEQDNECRTLDTISHVASSPTSSSDT